MIKSKVYFGYTLLLFSLLPIVTHCNRADPKKTAILNEIASSVQSDVAPVMMGTLLTTIEQKGYAGAVSFCSDFAQNAIRQREGEILTAFSDHYPDIVSIRLRRVSNKPRNLKGTPDQTEKKILDQWKNNDPEKPVKTTVVIDKKNIYYGLVPIHIGIEQCLKCHGTREDLDADAYKLIQDKYPEDTAIGYQLGDLRGAFSIMVEFK